MYRIYVQHLFFLGLALLSAVWNSVGNVETLRTPYISMKVGAFVTTETIATNSFVKCSSASEDIGHFVNFQPDAKECRIGSFDSAYVPAPGEESILVALSKQTEHGHVSIIQVTFYGMHHNLVNYFD